MTVWDDGEVGVVPKRLAGQLHVLLLHPLRWAANDQLVMNIFGLQLKAAGVAADDLVEVAGIPLWMRKPLPFQRV